MCIWQTNPLSPMVGGREEENGHASTHRPPLNSQGVGDFAAISAEYATLGVHNIIREDVRGMRRALQRGSSACAGLPKESSVLGGHGAGRCRLRTPELMFEGRSW